MPNFGWIVNCQSGRLHTPSERTSISPRLPNWISFHFINLMQNNQSTKYPTSNYQIRHPKYQTQNYKLQIYQQKCFLKMGFFYIWQSLCIFPSIVKYFDTLCASLHLLQHVFLLGFRALSLIQSYESTWAQLPPLQLPLFSSKTGENLRPSKSSNSHHICRLELIYSRLLSFN